MNKKVGIAETLYLAAAVILHINKGKWFGETNGFRRGHKARYSRGRAVDRKLLTIGVFIRINFHKDDIRNGFGEFFEL